MWEETNTIEFRHFAGTTDTDQLRSCLTWCKYFLNGALNTGETPTEILKKNKYNFPDFGKYCFKKEQLYQYTNHEKNSKKNIWYRLERLKDYVNLSEATLDQIYNAYKEIEQLP